ncbi:MAG: tetrapyrrole methylase [Deltaproteobacteria bacterium]|nr:tetrapyrrole methylase [Deltaproteobacteria bacterium]
MMKKTEGVFKRHRLGCLLLVLLVLLFNHALAETPLQDRTTGSLYLVGMGPGDPDLATLRAVKVVKEADLIICHKHLGEEFSGLLKGKVVEGPELGVWIWHGYGKEAADFHGKDLDRFIKSQKARSLVISKIRKALSAGKCVAILDSGDPLIYGPWGWCLEEFEDADPVVVPGLSCFNAANAALKRDVTWSDTVKTTILTANDWPGRKDTIDKLARQNVTMVIFTMGLEFEDLVKKLSTSYGPQTPIAVVCHAGYKEKERVIEGTLQNILEKIGEDRLPMEHLVYVGENVDFRWKQKKTAQRRIAAE